MPEGLFQHWAAKGPTHFLLSSAFVEMDSDLCIIGGPKSRHQAQAQGISHHIQMSQWFAFIIANNYAYNVYLQTSIQVTLFSLT